MWWKVNCGLKPFLYMHVKTQLELPPISTAALGLSCQDVPKKVCSRRPANIGTRVYFHWWGTARGQTVSLHPLSVCQQAVYKPKLSFLRPYCLLPLIHFPDVCSVWATPADIYPPPWASGDVHEQRQPHVIFFYCTAFSSETSSLAVNLNLNTATLPVSSLNRPAVCTHPHILRTTGWARSMQGRWTTLPHTKWDDRFTGTEVLLLCTAVKSTHLPSSAPIS